MIIKLDRFKSHDFLWWCVSQTPRCGDNLAYFYNYFTSFIMHQHGYKRKNNMCLFMSMTFILIKIKFDIEINNEEFLIITWSAHNKKENHHWQCVAPRSPNLILTKLQFKLACLMHLNSNACFPAAYCSWICLRNTVLVPHAQTWVPDSTRSGTTLCTPIISAPGIISVRANMVANKFKNQNPASIVQRKKSWASGGACRIFFFSQH
jgi:hypothetical protein